MIDNKTADRTCRNLKLLHQDMTQNQYRPISHWTLGPRMRLRESSPFIARTPSVSRQGGAKFPANHLLMRAILLRQQKVGKSGSSTVINCGRVRQTKDRTDNRAVSSVRRTAFRWFDQIPASKTTGRIMLRPFIGREFWSAARATPLIQPANIISTNHPESAISGEPVENVPSF